MMNSAKGKISILNSKLLGLVRASVLGVLFIFAAPFGSAAQTCCSGGVPLGGSLGLGTAESQSLQVLVTYDYNAINDLVSFSERLDDDTRSRTTQSSIIEINYGLYYSTFVKRPVDFSTFIRYRKQTEDLIDGGVFPSSGGQWVYAIPGVNISFSPSWLFRLSGDVPLYRKLDGTQLTTSYKITAALLFNIPLSKNELFIH
jgi:hypothetical protein